MTAAFSADTKTIVIERAKGRCDKCGAAITSGAHWHHRRARGMGSTKRPESSSPANCLLLHPACHDYVEKHRTESIDNGWLVRQQDDPRLMPVLLQGVWCLLFDDGTVRSINAGAGRGSPHPH